MNSVEIHNNFFIVNIDEKKGTFSIEETDQKPKSHHLALETLKNIEKVIKNDNLIYDKVDENDKYSQLERSKLLELFKNKSATIEKKYMKAASDCNWLSRLLFSEEKKLDKVYTSIQNLLEPPKPLPLRDNLSPEDFIQHELAGYLDTSTLAALSAVNRHAQTATEAPLISRAQEFGYTGKDPESAKQYIKNIFTELDILVDKGLLPAEYILKKDRTKPGVFKSAKVIDKEATLKELKKLSDEEFFKLLSTETFYVKPSTPTLKSFLLNSKPKTSYTLLSPKIRSYIRGALDGCLKKDERDVLEFLITNTGFDSNSQMYVNGDTFLHKAVKSKKTEIIDLLLANGGNINIKNAKSGRTPLNNIAEAIFYRGIDLSFIEYLISKGADPFISDNMGLTAFHCAALYGSLKGVKLFLESDPTKINIQTNSGNTALSLICLDIDFFNEKGRLGLVTYLLDEGADPTIANHQGITPLDNVKRKFRSILPSLFEQQIQKLKKQNN